MNTRPKLLFVVTEDWYFCSHRLALAQWLGTRGYDVTVATRVREHGETIRAAGIQLIPIDFDRRGKNPWREALFVARLTGIYRTARPDIVHHVGLKPVLYGSVAAMIAGVPGVVNALAGLGYVFSSRQLAARLLRSGVRLAFRLLFSRANTRIIVQNPNDLETLANTCGVPRSRLRLIRGSGVNMDHFRPLPEPDTIFVALFASRMLWDKGVDDFVEAARILKGQGIHARFVLAGQGDPGNPTSVPEDQLRAWQKEGVAEWWGARDDMPAVLAQSHVVCLPTSYGEGVPKVLIEAAASGRPIVASDVPGCREIVRPEENGILVPPRNPVALAQALRRLHGDPGLRQRMGETGRRLAVGEFSVERVNRDTAKVYEELSR